MGFSGFLGVGLCVVATALILYLAIDAINKTPLKN